MLFPSGESVTSPRKKRSSSGSLIHKVFPVSTGARPIDIFETPPLKEEVVTSLPVNRGVMNSGNPSSTDSEKSSLLPSGANSNIFNDDPLVEDFAISNEPGRSVAVAISLSPELNASCFPSIDHVRLPSRTSDFVSRVKRLNDVSVRNTSPLRVQAIVIPSGDHATSPSNVSALIFDPVPSVFIIQCRYLLFAVLSHR